MTILAENAVLPHPWADPSFAINTGGIVSQIGTFVEMTRDFLFAPSAAFLWGH